MNLETRYQELWEHSTEKFRMGDFELDPMLNAESDDRYGITLLARPSGNVREKILKLLKHLSASAPGQYSYPGTDLHITVLSIISCHSGFTLDQIDREAYLSLIRPVVQSVSPFRITFHGVTASPSSILIQGFPEENRLNELRDRLRASFQHSDLQHTIDRRYHRQTAHMTALRFKKPLSNKERFLKTLSSVRNEEFGSTLIQELEFVGNDWYQKQEKTELVERIRLGTGQS
ncbi:MAG: 2'-5' RNA ligase family protein [Balneolaceae bacterium]